MEAGREVQGGAEICEPMVDSLHCTAEMNTAKSLQSCPILCDPRDSSPRGLPVPGIFQARVLEWGAIAFSGNEHNIV